MTARTGPVVGVAVIALSVAASIVTVWRGSDNFAMVGLSFALVGGLLLTRRRGHLIGWVLGTVGLLVCTGTTAAGLALDLASSGLRTNPAVVALAWYGEWYWVPFLYLTLAGLPLLLPTGELRSPQAGRIWAAVLGSIAVATPLAMFQDALLAEELPPGLANPVGWLPYDDLDRTWVVSVVTLAAVGLGFAAVAVVLRRLRRASGVERQQLKVVASGAVATAFAFVLNVVSQAVVGRPLPLVVVTVTVGLTPLAILVAVLRYRLFEIDRIVSRTVTYTVVTAVLVGVYVAVAVVPAAVFDLQSDLLVAAATLAAAAAFVPVRRRVQSVVDRRFNRARYDAQLVVERFGVRLRGDTDLGGLTRDLHVVVGETVQPSQVWLWLPSGRR